MSTKIKIKITKDVLKESSVCGTGSKMIATKHCAFAVAVRDLLPEARVLTGSIIPNDETYRKWREDTHLSHSGHKVKEGVNFPISSKMVSFILDFDLSTPKERLAMSEKEFELEIPDWVLQLIGNGELEEVKNIISQSKTLELCPTE